MVGLFNNTATYPLYISDIQSPLPSYASIRVNVTIPHTTSGDLFIALISPDSSLLTLSDLDGLLIPNVFVDTSFVDGASNYVDDTFFTMAHIPVVAPSQPLLSFRGHNTTGPWTLVVVDFIAENVGYLDQWSIEFDRILPLPPVFNPLPFSMPLSS